MGFEQQEEKRQTSFDNGREMTLADKKTFLDWVLNSGTFWVYANDHADKNPVEGYLYLRPNDGRGNSLYVYWDTQEQKKMDVVLYESVGLHIYDFGDIYDGSGYIDSFTIHSDDAKQYIEGFMNMIKKAAAIRAEDSMGKKLKGGNTSNFFGMIEQHNFYNDFPFSQKG